MLEYTYKGFHPAFLQFFVLFFFMRGPREEELEYNSIVRGWNIVSNGFRDCYRKKIYSEDNFFSILKKIVLKIFTNVRFDQTEIINYQYVEIYPVNLGFAIINTRNNPLSKCKYTMIFRIRTD